MNADIKEQIFEKMAGWQESAEEWRSPEGKKIPYRKFSRWIEPENNDFDSYTISVSVWRKMFQSRLQKAVENVVLRLTPKIVGQ